MSWRLKWPPQGVGSCKVWRCVLCCSMCVNGARAGGIQIPGCTIASLINACNQFIEELEDFEEIPDMQMLARLVVIREEACNIDLQNRIKEGVAEVATNPLLASKAVPVTEIAFLKQLMPLSVGDARCGTMGRHALVLF